MYEGPIGIADVYSTYCESVLECYYIQPVYFCSVCITCDDLGLLHVQTV